MYPDDLKYTAEHEWVKVIADAGADSDTDADSQGDGAVLRIGITSYAQDALGDIVFVTLPAVGTEVEPGQPFGEVESTKSVSDVYSPLAGTVTALNEQLDAAPEQVNADPYGDGWLVEVRPSLGIQAALEDPALLDAAAYRALVEAAAPGSGST